MCARFRGGKGPSGKGNPYDLSASRDAAGKTESKISFGNEGQVAVPGQNDEVITPGQERAHMKHAGTRSDEDIVYLFTDEQHGGPSRSLEDGPIVDSGPRGTIDAAAMEKRRFTNTDKQPRIIMMLCVATIVVFIVCMLLPNGVLSDGVTDSFADYLDLVRANVANFFAYCAGSELGKPMESTIWRYVIILFAGAAYGITGAVYQGTLKNALASPTTLGVSAGATLGSMLFIVVTYTNYDTDVVMITASSAIDYENSLSLGEYFLMRNGQALCTLAGSLIVVVLVVAIANLAGRGQDSGVTLIVTGQVFMMVINAVSNLIRTYYAQIDPSSPISQALRSIRSASLTSYYIPLDALVVAVPVIACIAIVMAIRPKLNSLTFSDEEARSMGLATRKTRALLVGTCTAMTAIVIAYCGNLGFLGFLIPHLTRSLVGPNFKYLIPASAVVGSLFLTLSYFVSSQWVEMSGATGMFTSIVGGLLFIIIALRSRNKRSVDFV